MVGCGSMLDNLKTNFLFAPTLHAGKNFSKFFNEKSLVSRRIRVRSSIFLKFRKIFSGLLYTNKKLVLRFEGSRFRMPAKLTGRGSGQTYHWICRMEERHYAQLVLYLCQISENMRLRVQWYWNNNIHKQEYSQFAVDQ